MRRAPLRAPKLALLLAAPALFAQDFTQRGFVEISAVAFPQTAPNDSAHVIGQGLFRYEATYKPYAGLSFSAGLDARADTHEQTQRGFVFPWFERTRLRPAFDIRRLSMTYTHGKLTFEAGKQIIRWGKADVLNPTDRFAPRDYLNVIASDALPVTAARLTYGSQADSIDLVFSPTLTPSRVPLLNQRWVLPVGIPTYELPPTYPGGWQGGARYSHVGSAAEYSLSVYNGHDNLPLLSGLELAPGALYVERFYPQMRMYGGDAAFPLGGITLKTEAGYFTSTTSQADQYVLYVLQLERQAGEWSFVGGYAGQAITEHGSAAVFSPLRGFTRSLVAHAGYTIDVNRNITFEAVVRQNLGGIWAKAGYSQAMGQHWRITIGLVVIQGQTGDFIGQYRRNSNGILTIRYSF